MSTTRVLIESMESEYLRYKTLAEQTFAQLDDAALVAQGPGGSNSVAVLVWHLSGNFRSRFTDFLTTDGEKPWRKRDEEFEARTTDRGEIIRKWEDGWRVLLDALEYLDDAHLDRQVTIRSQPLFVRDALLRSLSHVSYHVGQIVQLGRMARGGDWQYLTIPPGQSEQYNQAPTRDAPPVRPGEPIDR